MRKMIFQAIRRVCNILLRGLMSAELFDEIGNAKLSSRYEDSESRKNVERCEIEGSDVKFELIHTCQEDSTSFELSQEELSRELRSQFLLRDIDASSFNRILNSGFTRIVNPGEKLARQGEAGDEIFLIITGEISIFVNEHLVDTSYARECVGEMVLFDTLRRRSATLEAKTKSLLFVVRAADLRRELMKRASESALPYNLAYVLSERLRKRERLCRKPNDYPLVFIGSSTESGRVAKRIEMRLKKLARVHTELWMAEDMFNPSRSTMEDLEKWIARCDFAVLVLSKDDYLEYRKEIYDSPRDNVIFELGYCMGRIGRERTLYLFDTRNTVRPTKVPSDIQGLTYIPYKGESDKKGILSAIDTVIRMIEQLGVRK